MTGRNEERSQLFNPPSNFPVPNVSGYSGGTYPTVPYAPSQQPQVQLRQSRSPPPPPPRNFPVQPEYPNLIGNQVPRSLGSAAYQPGMGYDSLFPEAFPGQEVFHVHALAPARAPDSAHYVSDGFATPGRPGPGPHRHQPPVQLVLPSGGYVFGRSPGPQAHISLPQVPHAGPSSRSAQPEQLYPVGSHLSQAYQPHLPVPLAAQPQQLYHVGSHQASQIHPPASQPYPPRVGQKKAVVVGINYSKHRDPDMKLEWGIYDAQVMARFLQEHLGFHPHNIRILTDDKRDKRKNRPTKANLVAAMHWLVEGAQSGDSLFFYFSGHATQIKDEDGDEPDGFDECLCAVDYDGRKKRPTGLIVDDKMHDIMVKPLPRGCRLTAVFDCCHSGTILDLPYIYDSQGVVKPNRPDIIQRKASNAVVISLSACKDNGIAFEAGGGGALRSAFMEYVMTRGNGGTPRQAIESLRAYMTNNNYGQRPQLSSSHWIDTDQRFIITG